MSAPKVGDRVRVVLEGIVGVYDDDSFEIGGPKFGNCVYPAAEHVTSIEILPRPLTVGDTIEGDQYDRAPVGTVVGVAGQALIMKCDDGAWKSTDGYTFPVLGPEKRTVVYVPEATS